MNLIETLKGWDTNLFLLVNGIHAPFFDNFMYAVSDKVCWIPLYISVLILLIKNWKKESIWLIISIILCIVISDQISSGILKDLVKRIRPSHVEALKGLVHLVHGYSGGNYGFASSHAANSFGFALLTSLIFNRKIYTYSIFIWAIITAYSRIYLGVHYPLDVLGGAVIGSLAALLCYWVIRKLRPSLLIHEDFLLEKTDILIPQITLSLSFIVIICYGIFY